MTARPPIALAAVLVLLVAAGFATLRLPVFGARADAEEVARFERSPNYDSDRGAFVNRREDAMERLREEESTFALLREWFRDRPDGVPSGPLPETVPDIDAFLAPGDGARVIWFGHSTFLLNVEGLIVLVDPVFSGNAAPASFMVPRFQPPVIGLDALPTPDVVLISHDHYDHLDMETVRFLATSDAMFLAPLGVGAHLRRWGVTPSAIVERDWWQSHAIGAVTFTAAPAQHFSGRGLADRGRTLWASWAIRGEGTSLYFSGDSGFDTHFAEIGERLGPFDVAFMENGQYDLAWRQVHLLPEETVEAFEALDARQLFPIHWGMFELAFHAWYAPPVALTALADARGIELVTPLIGEVVTLGGVRRGSRWWEPLVPTEPPAPAGAAALPGGRLARLGGALIRRRDRGRDRGRDRDQGHSHGRGREDSRPGDGQCGGARRESGGAATAEPPPRSPDRLHGSSRSPARSLSLAFVGEAAVAERCAVGRARRARRLSTGRCGAGARHRGAGG